MATQGGISGERISERGKRITEHEKGGEGRERAAYCRLRKKQGGLWFQVVRT